MLRRPPRSTLFPYPTLFRAAEQKLRRVGGLWSDEGAYDFFFERIPAGISTAKAFHKWRLVDRNEERLMIRLSDVVWEGIADELALFPDEIHHGEATYRIAYRSDPEAPDDGLCFEITIDELALFPRSEEHTSELQSRRNLVCRLLLEKKKKKSSN